VVKKGIKGKLKRVAATSKPPALKHVKLATSEDKSGGATQGHKNGATNYNDDEVCMLLSCMEHHLLMGSNGWEKVCKRYNEWASANSYHKRQTKGLKMQFECVSTTLSIELAL